MKRLLLFLPVSLIVSITLVVLAFNFGLFHSQFERILAEKSGSKVQLGSMTLIPKWPLRLELGDTSVEHPFYSLKWKSLALNLASLTPPYKLAIELEEPKFEMREGIEFKSSPERGGEARGGPASESKPLSLSLIIRNGDFKLPDVHLRRFALNFEQKLLLKSAARLHLQALVQSKMLPVELPLALDTDNLTLSMETVKGSDVAVSLGGLSATATGASLLSEGRHRWNASVIAPDLSKLPKPPMDIPARDWRGSIRLKAEIAKDAPDKPWWAEGDLQAENVSANVKYRADKLAVSGPFAAALSTHFRYVNGVPEISNLNGSVDLTSANVIYQDLLQKAPSVPLRASVAAQGDLQSLKLSALTLEVWKFAARTTGQVALAAPYAGQFTFDVPAFNLEGADKVFLPLSKSPASGQIAASGSWRGEILNAAAGHLALNALRIKELSADVDYDKPGVMKAKGPLKLSLEGRFEADKKTLLAANLKGKLDASDAALVAGPLRKEAKRILLADFEARGNGDALDVSALGVESFFGKMRVSGKVVEPFDPKVQLKLDVPALNLTELRVAMPEYHDKIPKGSASGQLNFKGSYAKDKPWNAWPLAIEGSVRLTFPEYVLAAAPPANVKPPPPKAGALPKTAQENESFLPPGYLVERLKLKVTGDIDTLKKDKLTLKGVHVDGLVSGSRFKGAAGVREIFGGSVDVQGLDVPLTDPRPTFAGTAKWRELIIEDALGFAKPEYRDFAKGRSAGQAEFLSYLPSDPEFMPFLKAKGELNAQPVTLNSVKIGDMINALLKQAPMLKLKPVKMDPLHGQLKADFNLQKQVLQIDSLNARDVDSSELQLKGRVGLPAMQGDFAGTFFWAKPQVQGCLLEGNSDATGRMIIPVAMKGDLMHPGLDSLSDLVNKLGAKALECEGKKLVEKVKKEGTKQLENEVKKQLQNIFGR